MAEKRELRRPTSKDSETASVVKKFIFSKNDSNEQRVGDWLIFDGQGATKMLSFTYFSQAILGDRTKDRLSFDPNSDAVAHFGFDIMKEENAGMLEFVSIHKRAIREFGTEALTAFETILQIVAQEIQQDIRITFRLHNQSDTKRWLEKNDYILKNPEASPFIQLYYKDIKIQRV